MGYNTVIFDLDGTLLDTLDDLMDSCNYALSTIGAPSRTKAEIRRFVGNGIRNLMKQAVPGGTEHAELVSGAQPDQDRTLCGGAGVDSDPARARHHHGRSIQ